MLAHGSVLEEAKLTEGPAFKAGSVRMAQIIAYLKVAGEGTIPTMSRSGVECTHIASGILLARVRGYISTETAIDCLNEIIVGAEIDEWS